MKLTDNIKSDIIAWFEHDERNQSGGIGYPTGSRLEPGIATKAKHDPTPNHLLPADLVFINTVIMSAPKNYKDVLREKYMTRYSDNERADKLNVSVPNYYILCREVTAWVAGNYNCKYTDRPTRKNYSEMV